MSDVVEVKVKVSNDEQKYTKKYLCYETIELSKSDAKLSFMVDEAVKEFKGPVEDVNVTFNMSW